MKMKIKKIYPNIFLVTFDKRYDLCMTFLRFQEFYESPKFRNKYFELEEFMDWWADKYGKGSFDYVTKWSGFNIPGYIICKWVEQMMLCNGRFRAKEKALSNQILKKLCHYNDSNNFNGDFDSLKNIYIIGVHTECSKDVLRECKAHEVAHAFYRLYREYKEGCKELLKNTPSEIKAKATEALIKLGYNKKVFDDELQAYFSTGEYDKGDCNVSLRAIDSFVRHFSKFQRNVKVYAG